MNFQRGRNIILKLLAGVMLLTLASHSSFAQHPEANIWYFGNHAGLDFNSGSPVAISTGELVTLEGCLSISDASGNLLFYSEGSTIWDRNHDTMPNGRNLWGHRSSTQSGVVVREPGSSTRYYVFTAAAQANIGFAGQPHNGIAYSVVDMTLNNGYGDVVAGQKNIPLVGPATEKVAAVRHCNGWDVWVVTHKFNSNEFYAYLVTSSGVQAPVISAVGLVHQDVGSGQASETIGYMKVAPDQQHLALACFSNMNVAQLFDFQNVTGVVSNPITLNLPASTNQYNGPYGVSFSIDGSRLYIGWHDYPGSPNIIYQYDITAGSAAAILASRTMVALTVGWNFGAMQLATDGKLYIANFSFNGSNPNQPIGSPTMGYFTSPNALGLGSGWNPNGVSLSAFTSCIWGLPDFIESFFSPAVATNFFDTTICAGGTAFFSPTYGIAMDSLSWDFGDPPSGALNFDTAQATSHTYTTQGNYIVTLVVHYNCHHDTIRRNVIVNELPIFGNDTSLCAVSSFTLDAGNPGSTYLWSTTATTQTITVTASGTYWVEVINGPCISRDTMTVNFVPNLPVNLGNDTTLCTGDTVTLNAGYPGATYAWSTGDTTQTIQVSTAGTFWVHVDDGICNGDDTVSVNFSTIPQINLGNDTVLCNGQVLTLDAGYAGYTYLWSTSSTSQTINVSTTGTYWLSMTNGICTVSDTINVDVITLLPVSLGPDTTVCTGIILNLQSSNTNANHLWSSGDTTFAINVNNQGTYWLEDNIGNCRVADTMSIAYFPPPTVYIGNDTSLCGSDEFTVQSIATNAISYLWNDGDVNTFKVITAQGIYWLEVISPNGCIARDTLDVNAYGCEFYLFVPNVFTPNGDHNNETFFPLGYNIVSGDMQIWDRWGELLYSTNDLTKGWDGTFKEKECPIDAYVWVINYSGIADDGSLKTKVKVGTVTLLR